MIAGKSNVKSQTISEKELDEYIPQIALTSTLLNGDRSKNCDKENEVQHFVPPPCEL